MTQHKLLLLLLYLACSYSVAGEKRFLDEPVAADEISTVKNSFKAIEKQNGLKERGRKFPDGAYGHSYKITKKRTSYSDDPAIQSEYELRDDLCLTDGLALVTAHSAKSFLTPKRSMVYTKYRLEVARVIATNGTLPQGNHILAISQGGEVNDGGEKFRVKNETTAEIQPEETYLVSLHALENKKLFLIMDALPVRNNRIYPEDQFWGGVTAGTPLDEFSQAAIKVQGTYCPNLAGGK